MPVHIGTSIALNTYDPMTMPSAQLAAARLRLLRGGAPVAELPDDALRELLHQRALDFRDNALTSPERAAAIILDGVRAGRPAMVRGRRAFAALSTCMHRVHDHRVVASHQER